MDRRNGRRRRVLRDESRNDDAQPLNQDEKGRVVGYSESALSQPSLTDLIPVRPLRVLVTILVGAAALLGLLVLDDWASANQISTFQMGKPGSLASWFASTILMWSAGGAVLTYLIRRHRTDDYRGAYHIWLWAAGFLAAASVAATSPWHLSLNGGLRRLTGVDLGANGWWLSTVGAVAMMLALRIAVEVRACRTALGLLVLALSGYVAVTLIQTGVVLEDQTAIAELAIPFGALASHLTLAYAVWWNARYVQLDARGIHAEKAARRAAAREARSEKKEQRRLNKEAARAKRRSKSSSSSSDDEDEDEEAEETKTSSRKRKTAAAPPRASTKPRRQAASDASDKDEDEEDAPDTLSLEEERKQSKADRRRERKKKRRMAA